MLLYLVLSAPLLALILCVFYRVTEPRLSAVVFLHGALVTVPLLLIWWLVAGAWEISYTASGLYLYHLVLHMLYPLLPGIGLFLLLERSLSRERGHVVVISMAAFLAGMYFVQSIIDVLRIPHYYSPYVAFLLPSLRVGLIAAVPALIGAASREPRPLRLVWATGVVLVPAAFGGVALLYHLNFLVLGHLLTALVTILALFMHVLLLGAYYPRRAQAFSLGTARSPTAAVVSPEADESTGGDDEEDRNPVTEVTGPSLGDA